MIDFKARLFMTGALWLGALSLEASTPLRYFFEKGPINRIGIEQLLGAKSQIEQVQKIAITTPRQQPIVPFLPLAVKMPWDLVMAVKDGPYRMYEFIRVDVAPGRRVWFSLDSKENGRQFIGLPENQEDAAIVKQIAQQLNIQTYEAALAVKQDSSQGLNVYFIDSERIDPEGEVGPRSMQFRAEIERKFDVENLSENNNLQPGNRNSHAMNHGQEQFLIAVDIYGSTPRLSTHKIGLKFFSPAPKMQKLLGTHIKSLIAQGVAGLRAGSLRHEKDRLEFMHANEAHSFYLRVVEGGELTLQTEVYRFERRGVHEQLKSIAVYSAKDKKPTSFIEFNPALPDFRYGLANKKSRSRMYIAVDAKDGLDIDKPENLVSKVMYVGQVQAEQTGDDSFVLHVVPGDPRRSENHRMKYTSEWFLMRPLSIIVNSHGVESYVMAPQKNNHTQSQESGHWGSEVVSMPQSFYIVWKKRPHRFNALSLNSLEQDQMTLEGGTWGNGGVASDQTTGQVCNHQVQFEQAIVKSSPLFPLRQDIKNFPFSGDHYYKGEAKSWGLHHLKILAEDSNPEVPIEAAIKGFRIEPGPSILASGITIHALDVRILRANEITPDGVQSRGVVQKSLPNGKVEIEIPIFFSIGFSPEWTRPYSGPFRQNFRGHSALAMAEVVAFKNYGGYLSHQSQSFQNDLAQSSSFLSDKPRIESSKCDGNQDSNLLRGFSFGFLNSQGQRASRYIRGISGSWAQGPKHLKVDNLGEMSWKTRVEASLHYLEQLK